MNNDYINSISLIKLILKQNKGELKSFVEEKERIQKKMESINSKIALYTDLLNTLKEQKDILENYKNIFWKKCKSFLTFYFTGEICSSILVFSMVPMNMKLFSFLFCTGFIGYLCYHDVTNQMKDENFVKKSFNLSDVEKNIKNSEATLYWLNKDKSRLEHEFNKYAEQEKERMTEIETCNQQLNEFSNSYCEAIKMAIKDNKVSAYQREILELGNRYSHELDTILNHEYEEQGMGLKLVKEET